MKKVEAPEEEEMGKARSDAVNDTHESRTTPWRSRLLSEPTSQTGAGGRESNIQIVEKVDDMFQAHLIYSPVNCLKSIICSRTKRNGRHTDCYRSPFTSSEYLCREQNLGRDGERDRYRYSRRDFIKAQWVNSKGVESTYQMKNRSLDLSYVRHVQMIPGAQAGMILDRGYSDHVFPQNPCEDHRRPSRRECSLRRVPVAANIRP